MSGTSWLRVNKLMSGPTKGTISTINTTAVSVLNPQAVYMLQWTRSFLPAPIFMLTIAVTIEPDAPVITKQILMMLLIIP